MPTDHLETDQPIKDSSFVRNDRNVPPRGLAGFRLLMLTNAAWNIANFRLGLLEALRQAGSEVMAAAPADGHEARIEAAGVPFHAVAMKSNSRSPLHDALLCMRLVMLMRRERPDVFLGYTIKANVYGSFAARLCGVPRINNIAGLGRMFSGSRWTAAGARLLYRLALAGAHHIFFQNEEDRRSFIAARIVDPGRTTCLPGSGIDLERFAPAREQATGGQVIFLLFGRLLREKGVEDFVAAARIVRAQAPEARFRLLGFIDDDSPASIGSSQIAEWTGDGTIDYLGTATDVRPALRQADCVVLPSYYREGTPRSLLEAAAMAVPIITTDLPGCRDVVDEGKSGFLVPPRDPERLAQAMLRMLALKREGRAALGAAGRAKVTEQFDERIVVNRYLDAIAQLPPRPR